MTRLHSGQWRCLRGRPGLAALKAAVWVLFAPAVATTQDSQEFILLDLDSDVLLMAELVESTVTFVDPTGIGALNDLHFGSLDRNLSDQESVTVAPDSTVTDLANRVVGGSQAPASLNVTASPDRPLRSLLTRSIPDLAIPWPISAASTTLEATQPATGRVIQKSRLPAVRCWLA